MPLLPPEQIRKIQTAVVANFKYGCPDDLRLILEVRHHWLAIFLVLEFGKERLITMDRRDAI
jgi:hypothetical protein